MLFGIWMIFAMMASALTYANARHSLIYENKVFLYGGTAFLCGIVPILFVFWIRAITKGDAIYSLIWPMIPMFGMWWFFALISIRNARRAKRRIGKNVPI